MSTYYRPLIQSAKTRSSAAQPMAGGCLWFDQLEVLARGAAPRLVEVKDVPSKVVEALISPRAPYCGVDMQAPSIMGILNTTPDSFSDGGQNFSAAHAQAMIAAGADILDVGGESTRPGADFVPFEQEILRTAPLIGDIRAAGIKMPISIDTRKAKVAQAAMAAGADIINDVTALTYDADSLQTAASSGASVCIMHAGGDPKTMQDSPQYGNVLLDVYDYLEARILACEGAGIPRARIMIDVGIGFGKTDAHNLILLKNMAIFHGLGCPILLGVSRKSLIGRLANVPDPADRVGGSIAIALYALNQGVQMLRVHDIAATKQAVTLWSALQD